MTTSVMECGLAAAPAATTLFTLTVAAGFVFFNSVRILLYLPQLRSCFFDRTGCAAINLWTWSGWIAANAFTALYMWIFLADGWGFALNLCNAGMCAVTVGVTLWKRGRYRQAFGQPSAAA